MPESPKSNVKAVLFDLDDTLFDRNRAQGEWVHLMMQDLKEVFKGIEQKVIVDALLESDHIATEEFNRTHSREAARVGRLRIFLKLLNLSDVSADLLV